MKTNNLAENITDYIMFEKSAEILAYKTGDTITTEYFEPCTNVISIYKSLKEKYDKAFVTDPELFILYKQKKAALADLPFTKDDAVKFYKDYKAKTTDAYVSSIVEMELNLLKNKPNIEEWEETAKKLYKKKKWFPLDKEDEDALKEYEELRQDYDKNVALFEEAKDKLFKDENNKALYEQKISKRRDNLLIAQEEMAKFKKKQKEQETNIKVGNGLHTLGIVLKLGIKIGFVVFILRGCVETGDAIKNNVLPLLPGGSSSSNTPKTTHSSQPTVVTGTKVNNTADITIDGKEINSLDTLEEVTSKAESIININGVDYSAIFQEAIFVRAIDGDTIVVNVTNEDGNLEERTVRLIGVNTPESVAPENYRTDNTEEGKQASDIVKKFFEDNNITTLYLQKDVSDTDKYGRDLRYVWTEIPTDALSKEEVKNKMLNAMLLSSITYNDGTPVAETAKYAPDTTYSDMFEDILEEI